MSGSQLPSSFDENKEFYEESRWSKFTRRLKEEPLIPFGCGLTCYALYRASRSIRSGDHHQTNRMFRARIYAQFFTIVCMVGGSYYYAEQRKKEKEYDKTLAEKKTMQKKDAWIRELEARDREDKEERELRVKREAREASKAAKAALEAPKSEAAKEVQEAQSSVSSPLEKSEFRRLGILDAVRELGGFGR